MLLRIGLEIVLNRETLPEGIGAFESDEVLDRLRNCSPHRLLISLGSRATPTPAAQVRPVCGSECETVQGPRSRPWSLRQGHPTVTIWEPVGSVFRKDYHVKVVEAVRAAKRNP